MFFLISFSGQPMFLVNACIDVSNEIFFVAFAFPFSWRKTKLSLYDWNYKLTCKVFLEDLLEDSFSMGGKWDLFSITIQTGKSLDILLQKCKKKEEEGYRQWWLSERETIIIINCCQYAIFCHGHYWSSLISSVSPLFPLPVLLGSQLKKQKLSYFKYLYRTVPRDFTFSLEWFLRVMLPLMSRWVSQLPAEEEVIGKYCFHLKLVNPLETWTRWLHGWFLWKAMTSDEFNSGMLYQAILGRPILKFINNAFLALIPKSSAATEMAEFRPIACINHIYKLLKPFGQNNFASGIWDYIPSSVGFQWRKKYPR